MDLKGRTVIYEDEDSILVKFNYADYYSFGLKREFDREGFVPVNQSCLTFEEAREELIRQIDGIAPEFLTDTLPNMLKALLSEQGR